MLWFVGFPILGLLSFMLCRLAATKINHRILPALFIAAFLGVLLIAQNVIAGGEFSLAVRDVALNVILCLFGLAVGGVGWLFFKRARYAAILSAVIGAAFFATLPYSAIYLSCYTGLSCI